MADEEEWRHESFELLLQAWAILVSDQLIERTWYSQLSRSSGSNGGGGGGGMGLDETAIYLASVDMVQDSDAAR